VPLTTMNPVIQGRFRLGDEITSGNFSTAGDDADSRIGSSNAKARVFIAEDLDNGAIVAVKILIHNSSKLESFRSRFQRDAEIMCSFEHSNVVKTIASGITSEGQLYLVMEYLQGQTLAARIAEKGPIPASEMSHYLQQVASALDAAHARGIVHRDIHPGTLLVQAGTGDSPSIKLLGFSLGKDLTQPSDSEIELTSKQSSLGTAVYLSPEQARGVDLDGRADVYALGVTLYEALTGRIPFEEESDFQILLAKINGRIPPFPEAWSEHENAQAIESVVLQTMAKDPADRPASAGSLARLFQDAIVSRQKRKFAMTWPSYLAASGLLVTSLLFLAKWLF
jgi:serine/threonine protein kinase